VWDQTDVASLWSQDSLIATALLDAVDWTASWISRAVPAELRPHRSLSTADIEWAKAGEVLEQPVPTPPGTTLVVPDLRERGTEGFAAKLELVTPMGQVLAERDVVNEPVPLDHFARFLEVDAATPSDGCMLRLKVVAGEIGWRSGPVPALTDDDGVSPVLVRAPHLRNGHEAGSVLSVGVEVTPAPNPVFTKSFILESEPVAARLYAAGLGYGHFRINGTAVSDATLEPAQTNYERRVLYGVHDVTSSLRRGDNAISAALGRGFWSVRGGDTWGWHLAPWNREPQLIAQLEILESDGRRTVITSDETWQAGAGEVVSDLLYTGVTYRLGVTTEWEPAHLVAPPSGKLRTTALPPVRRRDPIASVATHLTPGGARVIDFGKTLAGRVRCTLGADAPGELLVRYGELVDGDGTVICENPLAAGETQVDRVIVDGPLETFEWEPEFTYKGFRYVEISVSGGVHVDDVVAVPMHNAVRPVGSFECEDETLTWIDGALSRTFANNLHGIPTDTPLYEKNGWTADAHLGTTGALHHHELRWAFAKWMDDHEDAQAADGGIPQIIPTPGWGLLTDPAWSASSVLIPWDLYWEYGDTAELAKRLPMMIRYAEYALNRVESEGWIWRAHGWGDWLSPGNMFPPEGAAPTSTLMLLRAVQRVADACSALGRDDDAERFRDASGRLAEAYHSEYFDPQTRHYAVPGVAYRQAMNVLPLAFGAVPEQYASEVFASLESDLLNRTSRHLDCGAAGVKQLLPVLDQYGRADLAIDVATQPTRPGWGEWRAAGDTLWESWDADARSRNHYFLGSIAFWIQQRVGGLRATAPGWSEIEVAPVYDDRICWGRISHDSVRGRAAVGWSREGTDWRFRLDVPNGATATVRVPGADPVVVGEGPHELTVETQVELTP